MSSTPELFHEIANADCAEARRLVVAWALEERVAFRNLFYPEARADFEGRGGKRLPALWDGAGLHQGLAAVTAQLERLRAGGNT